MQQVQEQLKYFYNLQAKKYSDSRNKIWNDADIILDNIKNKKQKSISILEFGCGSGRLLKYLNTLKGIKINYIGVDISEELIKFAKKNIDPDNGGKFKFVCQDIVKYIKTCKQESFDFVIGIASFQHIPTYKDRLYLIKNFYRILKYGGELIMTNRSFSLRFISKYKIQILKSLLNYIISFGKKEFNNILIPWRSQDQIFYRFYHIFTLQELKKLIIKGGFNLSSLTYLDGKGKNTQKRTQSNNSICIASKQIFKS